MDRWTVEAANWPWLPGRAAATGWRVDLSGWKREGVDTVLTLLTPEEEKDLDLRQESGETKKQGMEFVSFPIPDRQIPKSEAKWAELLEEVTGVLSEGKNVVVHCRQGIGRSGLVAACLLVRKRNKPGSSRRDGLSRARDF